VWSVVKLAARAASWRTTPEPALVGFPVLLAACVALAAVRIALEFAAAGVWHFNPYGLNAVVAYLALELAVAALFVRPEARLTALSAMLILSMTAEIVMAAIALVPPRLVPSLTDSAVWNSPMVPRAFYAIAVVWWIGAMTCVIGSLEWQTRIRLMARAVALWAALFVANAVVPHVPVFLPPNFDGRTANWWEALAARMREEKSGPPLAQLEQAQPSLTKAEIDRLPAQRAGVTDIYVLGVAGWSDDVFAKELDGALDAISGVLPIKDRTVRLINNRETLANVPLANIRNFEAALHGIGAVMDKDEDVLIVLMTSHGTPNGFGLQLPTGVVELTPQEVASSLEREGIKNRVVIVSACYAGIFVPPLANDTSIVITAADAKNTSFGCAPERDWTYFGDAYFRQSLHAGSDFETAFAHARVLIEGWELMDHVPRSNPQGAFGQALMAKLSPYFATNPGQ
jgi:hypothetical protein